MSKKTEKSRSMQNHKKPADKQLLKEEFGHELGDMNAAKTIELLELVKYKKKDQEDKCQKEKK
ncbi:hypothetical protein [Metabacillus sp. RGM 3146]|uniref:hypothetical protein n=1 Tax=Metabacillus sp. RGM 3146 TaxID=3401092 RepID=UPI003B9D53A4